MPMIYTSFANTLFVIPRIFLRSVSSAHEPTICLCFNATTTSLSPLIEETFVGPDVHGKQRQNRKSPPTVSIHVAGWFTREKAKY